MQGLDAQLLQERNAAEDAVGSASGMQRVLAVQKLGVGLSSRRHQDSLMITGKLPCQPFYMQCMAAMSVKQIKIWVRPASICDGVCDRYGHLCCVPDDAQAFGHMITWYCIGTEHEPSFERMQTAHP